MIDGLEALKDLSDAEIEAFIAQTFDENYERLQVEGGHALTPYVKNAALKQVLFYWKKLRDIATNVTDTEVKLTLPDQLTPKGRNYTIEGVVDIVRENDRTVMYDIKTHDPDYVRADLTPYEEQLNVYAHIWQELRDNELDETAIIATAFPAMMREAISRRDERWIEAEFEKWEPLIDVPLDKTRVAQTIEAFGAVVDCIEDKQFAPPPVDRLKSKVFEGARDTFATRTCRNCDARFSCSSYRNYAISTNSRKDFNFSEYFADFDPSGLERMERVTVTLEAQPIAAPEDTFEND